MKKILTASLPLVLVAGVIAVSAYQLSRSALSFFHLALILTYIVWLLFEMKISIRDSSESHVSFDRLTREFYAASQAAVVLSAIFFMKNPAAWMQVTGSFIFIAGLIVRISAVQYLGVYYSHKARLIKSHKIITAGPYSVIRHPAYAGMILAHLGLVVAFHSYVAAGILALIFLPCIIIRLRIEESMLMKISGYRRYAHKTKRLVPLIW